MPLGAYPTPVHELPSLSPRGVELWVKRDDLTHPLYGGNKVRKLEGLLSAARERGKRRLVVIGAAGSHHVLASAAFGGRAGFGVDAVLVPQRRTDHVVENLRSSLGQGIRPFPVRSWGAVPRAVASLRGPDAYVIMTGGSNVVGSAGYVAAARELADQIAAGELPEPDAIVVTLGSGGTAAGLAVGLEAAGLRAELLAVCVSDPAPAIDAIARSLIVACARRAGVSPLRALSRMHTDARYLGAGYGAATEWGSEAMRVGAEAGLVLDEVYTGKTFAAVLETLRARAVRRVLYWHTLSSAPLEPLLNQAPKEEDLPGPLRALLR